jgi:hypothetical protein
LAAGFEAPNVIIGHFMASVSVSKRPVLAAYEDFVLHTVMQSWHQNLPPGLQTIAGLLICLFV